MRDDIFDIELHRLADSPSQPRSTYTGIPELADSILQHGLLQPIICRPIIQRHCDSPPEADLEIVCGHRRTRAMRYIANAQGDDSLTIQAIIKPMTDLEVLQTQIVENGQREDITPLDEARSYALLRDQHGQSTIQIALALAVSHRHVQARLQLLKLTGATLAALTAGDIGSEIAVLISGLPPTLQDRALDRIAPANENGARQPLSLRAARDALRHVTWLQPIMSAPFDILNNGLIDCAGSCIGCPNNSTRISELQEDIGSDICTDPTCYAAKTRAHGERELDKLREQGWTIADQEPPLIIHSQAITPELVEEVRSLEQHDTGITSILTAWPHPVTGLPMLGWTVDGRARYHAAKYPPTLPARATSQPEGEGESVETTVATKKDTSDHKPVTRPNTTEVDALDQLTERIIEGILTTDTERTEDELLYIVAELCSTAAPKLLIRLNLPHLWDAHEDRLDQLRSRDANTLGRIALAAAVDMLRGTYSDKKTTEILTLLAPRYLRGEGNKASLASEASTASVDLAADESNEVKADLTARRPAAKNKAVKYTDPATGQTWTGRGLKPKWLTAALNAGHTLSEFQTPPKQTDNGALTAADTTTKA